MVRIANDVMIIWHKGSQMHFAFFEGKRSKILSIQPQEIEGIIDKVGVLIPGGSGL